MHLDYPAQLEAKRQQVADALARIGGIDAPVLPCLGMDEPWRFRNKGQFPIGLLDQGPAVGFYALRSHRLIPLADCPVLHPAARRRWARCRLIWIGSARRWMTSAPAAASCAT